MPRLFQRADPVGQRPPPLLLLLRPRRRRRCKTTARVSVEVWESPVLPLAAPDMTICFYCPFTSC